MRIKHLLLLICFVLALGLTESYAQAPQQFNYQGAARNANGTPLANRQIALKISILDGSANGTSQYSEVRSVTTNQLGLYHIIIGSPGAISTTGSISAVSWSSGLKYIKVEVDPNNGSSFNVAGTAQLLSVPYALYAASGGSGSGNTIISGNGAPTSGQGANGDYYIDNATNIIYGPKTNGTWPAGKSLVGPQGIQGPAGPQGLAGANGKGIDGVTVNADGTLTIKYTDGTSLTTTNSLKGQKGDPGIAGTNGKGINNTVVNSDGTITITYSDGTTTTTTGSVKGPKGDPGVAGANGTNGKGITNTVVNNDGTITITYNDGTSTTTTGSVKGPKGDPGVAGANGTNGKGITNTVVNNDGTITITYNDGTSTTTTGSVKGPKGDPGVAGANGTNGKGISSTVNNNNGTYTFNYTDGSSFTTANLTGPAGANGTNGINGANGQDGRGISSTINNNNGTYTFNYTDGSTFTTANLTGPAGTNGTNGTNGRGINTATDNGNGSVTFTYSDGTTFTTIPTTNVLSKSGTNLTSTVNGVASTTDLQSVITAGTTVSNGLTGANLTTTVNGVTGAPVNLQPALAAATTVSNTLAGANLSTTVNGVTGTPVDLTSAINAATTNVLSKTGTNLTSTVNGVSSTTDLQSVISAGTTVSNSISGTSLTTTVNGVAAAPVNIQAAINAGTTVANTSAGNTLTTTVNGVTGTGVNLVNTNATSLSGTSLTTTVNGIASTALDLTPALNAATTNTLTTTNGNLVSTVNGVASAPAVAVLTSASNGLTATNGDVKLGGALTAPTTITTTATNTLTVAGLQNGAVTDKVLTADANGIVKSVDISTLNSSSWNILGNAGTNGTTNFLGTTDAQPLKFRVNNQQSGFLNSVNTNTFYGFQSGAAFTGLANDGASTLNNPRVSGAPTLQFNKSVGIGYKALANIQQPVQTVAIGAFALGLVDNPYRLTAIGYRSQYHMTGNSPGNTSVGYNTLSNNPGGSGNTAVGSGALSDGTDGAGILVNGNVVLGTTQIFSGATNFDRNILIGNGLDIGRSGSLSDRLMIGTSPASGGNANAIIDGDLANKVLTINNTLKITDLNSAATTTTGNRPVVADANGQLKIGAAAAYVEPWNEMGTNVAATLNNQNIYQLGNVAIGATSSASKLNVVSTVASGGSIPASIATFSSNTQTFGGTNESNAQIQIIGYNGSNNRSVTLGIGNPTIYGTHDNGFLNLGAGSISAQVNGAYKFSTDPGVSLNGNLYKGFEFYNSASDNQDAYTFYSSVPTLNGTLMRIKAAATAGNGNLLSVEGGQSGANVVIDKNGQLGIGLSAPTATFDVQGTAKISSLNSAALTSTGNRPVVADASGQLMIGAAATTSTSAIVTVNTAYTVSATDRTIIADASTAGFTITLPAATVNSGRELIIRKADETTNVLTFDQNLKYSVSTNITTVNSLSTLHIQSDGTNWWVINKGL